LTKFSEKRILINFFKVVLEKNIHDILKSNNTPVIATIVCTMANGASGY
jgi:hypothetical protein